MFVLIFLVYKKTFANTNPGQNIPLQKSLVPNSIIFRNIIILIPIAIYEIEINQFDLGG